MPLPHLRTTNKGTLNLKTSSPASKPYQDILRKEATGLVLGPRHKLGPVSGTQLVFPFKPLHCRVESKFAIGGGLAYAAGNNLVARLSGDVMGKVSHKRSHLQVGPWFPAKPHYDRLNILVFDYCMPVMERGILNDVGEIE